MASPAGRYDDEITINLICGGPLPSAATWRHCVPPYVLERDEDGVWCAHAQLRPGVGAHGEGVDAGAAVDDLREALTGLIAEFGVRRG